ncbi:hypothetical protein BDN72DRAFT_865297 [Pluteus cervinus]|uniref:Uncharacterized protein n=1 Tax=Pluteus cervinus TaxID=181527 RepID=A0ACD3A0U6_9AGAR|nr:hypothetical protein BDN72DRAFT_865297 [Pluteus cervinus]
MPSSKEVLQADLQRIIFRKTSRIRSAVKAYAEHPEKEIYTSWYEHHLRQELKDLFSVAGAYGLLAGQCPEYPKAIKRINQILQPTQPAVGRLALYLEELQDIARENDLDSRIVPVYYHPWWTKPGQVVELATMTSEEVDREDQRAFDYQIALNKPWSKLSALQDGHVDSGLTTLLKETRTTYVESMRKAKALREQATRSSALSSYFTTLYKTFQRRVDQDAPIMENGEFVGILRAERRANRRRLSPVDDALSGSGTSIDSDGLSDLDAYGFDEGSESGEDEEHGEEEGRGQVVMDIPVFKVGGMGDDQAMEL